MQTEITIGKTVYEIEVLNEQEKHTAYMLRHQQKNGKVKELALLRNVPNPTLLFAVQFPGIKPTSLWFSDKGGELKQVRVH